MTVGLGSGELAAGMVCSRAVVTGGARRIAGRGRGVKQPGRPLCRVYRCHAARLHTAAPPERAQGRGASETRIADVSAPTRLHLA